MLRNLQFIDEYEKDALKRVSSWIVVVRTIVIHASNRYVARTGTFGFIDDAPVQLVYVSNEDRAGAFLDLAEESQRKGHAFCPQNLRREFTKEKVKGIKHTISTRHLGDGNPAIRVTIISRLCIEICIHSRTAEEGFRPPPETNPSSPPKTKYMRGISGQYLRDRGRFLDTMRMTDGIVKAHDLIMTAYLDTHMVNKLKYVIRLPWFRIALN